MPAPYLSATFRNGTPRYINQQAGGAAVPTWQNPPAGAEVLISPPVGKLWVCYAINVGIICDATIAARSVTLGIAANVGANPILFKGTLSATATQTKNLLFTMDTFPLIVANDGAYNGAIKTFSTNLQVGDSLVTRFSYCQIEEYTLAQYLENDD